VGLEELRPSMDKVIKITQWPAPTYKADVDAFCYLLPYLRTMVPGRADLERLMKSSIVTRVKEYKANGKTRRR
jgi:hypothetical protein